MSRRLGSQIRNQWIGVLSLFLVLTGGTAYATHPDGANTISSADIIDGQVKEADVGQAAVASNEVKNDSILPGDVAPNSLTSGRIADGSLIGADVANGSLTGTDLAPNSVPTGRISDGSLTGADVKNDSLKGADIDESTLSLGSGSSPPAFTNATLQNSWTVAICCPTPAGFYKHADRVYLRGYITGPENTTAFVLPVGYRPSSSPLILPVYSCCGAVTGMSIHSNGEVTPFGSAASLSGVSFRVNE